MLHFNELRVTPDNKFLIIDVSVDKQECFNNILLDSIVIDTQDTYVPEGPSSSPLYTYTIDTSQGHGKTTRLELDIQELKVLPCSTMFFVYVVAKGTPVGDVPEGLDKNPIMGTVISLRSIYKQTLAYLRQVECDCEIPKGFINMVLRFKAIELCVRTGNYPQAIKYWKRFFMKPKSVTSNCGCYG